MKILEAGGEYCYFGGLFVYGVFFYSLVIQCCICIFDLYSVLSVNFSFGWKHLKRVWNFIILLGFFVFALGDFLLEKYIIQS